MEKCHPELPFVLSTPERKGVETCGQGPKNVLLEKAGFEEERNQSRLGKGRVHL